MRNVSALAARLGAEASEGSDPPLPMVLPHTRILHAMSERGAARRGWGRKLACVCRGVRAASSAARPARVHRRRRRLRPHPARAPPARRIHPPGHQPPRGADLGLDEWPPGCVGFAANLLRPAVPGTRPTVMYAQVRARPGSGKK